jgi:hypothetical protein
VEVTNNFEFTRMTPVQQAEFQAWLTNYLKAGLVEVTFRKVSGETRVMPCTLNADLIPVRAESENQKQKKTSQDVCKVFVPELNAWRSFRWDSIIKVEIN